MIPPLSEYSILPWESGLNIKNSSITLPPISIVIPIFNSGYFLEKTLRSLLCNDLSGVEIILMDGGSTDNTMDVVKYYENMFTVIRSEKDSGQSDAINKGFELAGSEILYWLNGDDLILPNVLNMIRRYFNDHQTCHALVGNAYMTELDLTPINHFIFNKEKLHFKYLLDYSQNHLVQPSVFFTKTAWDKCGPLDIHDHYAMDADLFISIAKMFKFHHIDMDIAYSVYHEACKTRGARAESISALALVQAKHGGIREAKATLSILIDLYHQLEKKSFETLEAKIGFLESQLSEIKEHTERQKEELLELDIRSNK